MGKKLIIWKSTKKFEPEFKDMKPRFDDTESFFGTVKIRGGVKSRR